MDPLAPVTVICPSHLSALQLRRRLAERTAFAAVRFETLPRLAELVGASALAAQGRLPLARPIGDHLAERVAGESRPPLERIHGLAGYARALRRLFTRLRRGGLVGGEEVPPDLASPHLREVMRLYGLWRGLIRDFYDEDDLLAAAAAVARDEPARVAELGALHLVPPGPRSADGEAFLAALGEARGGMVVAADPPPSDDVRMILAPDRASEAREAAREVITALEEGLGLHEIAVLHGADRAYARPLREALEAAAVPIAAMPGLPLVETPAGRGVLELLAVVREDLSRTALMDTLSVAPMRRELPAADGGLARLRLGRWDRVSRAAGVTHGIDRWRTGLRALCDDRRARMEAARRDGVDRDWLGDEIAEAQELLGVVETLWARLVELVPDAPAAAFLARLRAVVADYLDPEATGMAEVLAEVERLGTVDAVGGTFSLARFSTALRVNLEAASLREGRAGEGVLVADHRVAAGLRFGRTVLCGAAEGLLPAGPGMDSLVPDAAWAALRRLHPHIEDAALRIARSREAAERAMGSARAIVMTCPLYEGAGAHEHYPSPAAVAAARRRDPEVTSATALRQRAATAWLARPPSPLAAHLRGPAIDAWEVGLRAAVRRVRDREPAPPDDPLARPLEMLRARAGDELSAWDGNLAGLAGTDWMALPQPVSPTRLQAYGMCGLRFLMDSLLGLRVPEEPRDAENIDALVRGSLVHETLEAFFREQHAAGRPAVGEGWTGADEARVLEIFAARLADFRARGLTGLPVFLRQDERALRADLREFLHRDTAFRRATGAVPFAFERRIDEIGPGGQRFVGYVDRMDRVPGDGRVWIVDYKTGSVPKDDGSPLGGGTKLQLPVYLLAAPAGAPATALYWYISDRGGFQQVAYEATPANQEVFAGVIDAIGEGVRAGSFPAVPGDFSEYWVEFANCGRCDFTRICARARGDDFARKAPSAGVDPWTAVAAAAHPGEEPG